MHPTLLSKGPRRSMAPGLRAQLSLPNLQYHADEAHIDLVPNTRCSDRDPKGSHNLVSTQEHPLERILSKGAVRLVLSQRTATPSRKAPPPSGQPVWCYLLHHLQPLIHSSRKSPDVSISFHSANDSWKFMQLSSITDKNCQLKPNQQQYKGRQLANFVGPKCLPTARV